MKKRFYLILITLTLCFSLSSGLCGCKKDKDSQSETSQEAPTEANNDTTASSSDNSSEENQNTPDVSKLRDTLPSSVSEETTSEKQPGAMECMTVYQDFLNNKYPLYTNKIYENISVSSEISKDNDFAKYLLVDTPMTFSEFLENYHKGYKDYYGTKTKIGSISYSYMDCGNDGIPELAVLFTLEEDYNTDNTILVLKYFNDRLDLIFNGSYAYRTYGYMNKYGYYNWGGSGGAMTHGADYEYIDANGKLNFIYGATYNYSAYGFYVPDDDSFIDRAENLGISENIELDTVYFEDYDYVEDYDEWIRKKCFYTFYPITNNGNVLEGDAYKKCYESGSDYKQLVDSTGFTFYTPERFEQMLADHEKEMNITDEIKNAGEVTWTTLSSDLTELLTAWSVVEPVKITLDTPKWTYYSNISDNTTTPLNLSQLSVAPNDIIDAGSWADSIGWTLPDRLSFEDDTYLYKLSGLDSSGYEWYPYILDICDLETGDSLYSIDFSNYYYPDEYISEDKAFVEESVHWATVKDNILYVSTFHNTYASSGPHNGYITAFDMNNDFEVLWRTEPLTCNSNNFLVTDDAIICGYGFTAEDDYIYILNRSNGQRQKSILVKTSPDYFRILDNRLYVRCYNVDYVYDINN